MPWFRRDKKKAEKQPEKKVKIPEGLWIKCDNCREIIYKREIERNSKICPKCNYHFRISARERIELIIDEGSFREIDADLKAGDPIGFKDKDSVKYPQKVKDSQKKTGLNDAIIAGEGTIGGMPVVCAVLEFGFMGGSMGSVVGEKVARSAELAQKKKRPLIVCASSGGARMHEGIYSLMQMAKTSAAIGRLQQAGLPFISLLTDPTFGGVTASFAMLGDIIIAEPKSLIGFAGPRVIEQTIKQQLPEGFQRAEFLLEHGMVDMIVDRKTLKETLVKVLSFFS